MNFPPPRENIHVIAMHASLFALFSHFTVSMAGADSSAIVTVDSDGLLLHLPLRLHSLLLFLPLAPLVLPPYSAFRFAVLLIRLLRISVSA